MDPGTSFTPRNLAADLRARSDEQLAALLTARPDLAVPVPSDLGVLATRGCQRLSVLRALDRLDRFHLELLDAFLLLDEPTTYAELRELVGGAAPEDDVRRGVDALRTLALVWGNDERLHLVAAAREAGSPYPAGLGRPVAICLDRHSVGQLAPILAALGLPGSASQRAAVTAVEAVLADRTRVAALLAAADPAELEVLRSLAAGPPLGALADALAPPRAADAESPVRRLLARTLLVAVDTGTVELPREVGLALRGDAALGPLHPRPPALDLLRAQPNAVDDAAAHEARTAMAAAEALLEGWGRDPPPVLRAGGLGVRELRRAARDLNLAEPVVGLLTELVYAGGLLDRSAGPAEEWRPTPAYDRWRAAPAASRWVTLAQAWLDLPRLPGLAGARDERDKVLAPLGPELDRASAPELRRWVLLALAELPAATAPTKESLRALLAWRAPRRGGRLRDALLDWTLAEAAALGVTGLGALSAPGRALLAGDDPTAAARLAPLLPAPLDHVLLQADLTAVAPGPLVPELAHELALVADVESSGGATVYRISQASVRRALDAGRSAAALHDLFATHSRTPVPQALTYLLDDVARRHGMLRVGTATSYLRCKDESLLTEVLAARRAEGLRLRRLAPTVLTAAAPVQRVLEVLRSLGYAPVAESPAGAVVLDQPDVHRTPRRPRQRRAAGAELPAPSPEQLSVLVRDLRAGDRAAREARRAPVTQTTAARGVDDEGGDGRAGETGSAAATLPVLQRAARERRLARLGFVDAQGRAGSRVVEPVRVGGGYLAAYDESREHQLTFSLHRVTAVTLLDVQLEERTGRG